MRADLCMPRRLGLSGLRIPLGAVNEEFPSHDVRCGTLEVLGSSDDVELCLFGVLANVSVVVGGVIRQ